MKHKLHFLSLQSRMGRIVLSLSVFLVCVNNLVVQAQDISLAGVPYRIDTIQQMVAGPGCEYLSTRMTRVSDGKGPLDVYFLRVDVRNPYIRLEQVLGKDQVIGTEKPTAMMARKSTPTSVYVGGTNGDFFVTQGDVGTPIGLTIGNNEFAYIGHPHYKVGVVKEDGRPEIGNWMADRQATWVYSGKLVAGNDTFPIHHVNYHRYENELVLYNHYQGASTGTNNYGSEAVLSLLAGEQWTTSGKMKAKVESVTGNGGNTLIEADKFVLSGHGAMQSVIDGLQAGDEVEIIYSLIINGEEMKVAQCVSGHQTNLMVDNGVVVTENFWNELHPRTGYGYSQTGDTIIFCVVDGRTARSVGCTTQVLGAIMKHYGAWWALNWDGGGSSCMAINHFGQMNHGSDSGGERAVCNAMFVVADVPEDDQTIVTILPHEATFAVPHYGIYTPKFYGYNKYGLMVDTDVQGVVLSCDTTLGEIHNGNEFIASGTQSGLLHATFGTATTDIQISFVSEAKVSFRLDSILLDNRTSYEMEVTSPIGNNIVKVAAHVLTWQSGDEEICKVSETGALLGVNDGLTYVIGSLGSFCDTIQVRVENPTEAEYVWEDFVDETDSWVVSASSGFNPTFVAPETEGDVALQFTYKTSRKPFVQLEKDIPLYGLPDSIRLLFRTDAVIESIVLGVYANNNQASSSYIRHTFDSIDSNVDVVLSVSTADILGGMDYIFYPIWMKSLRLNISTSTSAGVHNIFWKGIVLYYDGVDVTYLDHTQMPTWAVYPNPVENGCLQISNAQIGANLVLCDIQGRLLVQDRVGAEHVQIDMQAYPAGQYLLTIDNQTVKIIKK